MKTIYIKAEVIKKYDDTVDIKIGDATLLWVNKKSLKQAQVLAFNQVREFSAIKNKKVIIAGGSIYLDEIIPRKQLQYEELTELVRGKERTLEDVIKDIKELVALESINPKSKNMDLIYKKLEEAEQLLKNRE